MQQEKDMKQKQMLLWLVMFFVLVSESLLFTPLSSLQVFRLHPPPCAILPVP